MKRNLIFLIRKIYELIPFKKYIYYLLREVYHPNEYMLEQLYFGGSFKVNYQGYRFKMNGYNKRGFSLENKLFWQRNNTNILWEKQSIELWIQATKLSEVVFDIGANTGFYSLLAKTINPQVQVYGFEPMEHICNWYIENCKLNSYNINCFSKALSNKSGITRFYAEKTNQNLYSGSLDLNFAQTHSSKKIHTFNIEATTIKEFVELYKIQKIDLMKIDVEGLEYEVFEGMGGYLEMFLPSMLVEVLSNEVGKNIQRIIEPLGYLFFNLNKLEKPNLTDEIRASDDLNYFFCIPEIAHKLDLI